MTLTETARLTKKGAVVLIILITAFFTTQAVWARVKDIIFPPKVPPPEVAFGKLPVLEIPNLPLKEGSDPEYVIDTKTGRLPTDLPDRAKVYKIILPTPTHLTSTRAKELAAKLGFSEEPKKLSSIDYSWEDEEEEKSLKMNINTGDFTLETDIKNLGDLAPGSTPSKAAAVEQAKRFLSNLNLLSDDYLEGRKESTYLKIEGESLRKVESLSEAQLTRVDFFREINEQPIVGPRPYEGSISVILGKEKTPFVFYNSWPLDPLQSTTYPIKTPQQVWSEVEEGRAKLTFLAPPKGDPFASYEPQDPETIFVRRIFLGYFDSEKLQGYFQPVYILEGLGVTADKRQLKYIAYIPAIAYDWIEESK